MGWDAEFVDGARLGLGRWLTGDTVGSASIPTVARLEQDVRVAGGVPGFVASLGKGILSVRQERRTYPVTTEVGITKRLSVRLTVPIVRVATRTRLQLASKGANLGLNPLLAGVSGADGRYTDFFNQFDSTLAGLNRNIAAGMYSCPPRGPCPARDDSAAWHAVRDALYRTVYGVGQTGSPFMPIDTSDGGRGIDTTVALIQRELAAKYGISGFADTFLLPRDSLSAAAMELAILEPSIGFGYRAQPFRNSFRYALGDVEIAAKYRVAGGGADAHYAAAVVALGRLPTGAVDSADDWLRQSIGDHQTDLEARLIQELTVANRLWLNLTIRAGIQRPGTRVRRVAPFDAILVPFAATADLAWDPGDYVGMDVAPLYRLAPQFAVGLTASYWIKQQDRYSFRSAQDSLDLAARLGVPTSAAMLDDGTAERRLRFGLAVTYVGPTVEGGFSIEQTVSGGTVGVTPAAPVYRIVLRTSRRLF